MIIYDVVQGTEEWMNLRCGVPSASNFDKIITTKGAKSKQSQKYLYQLAGEKVSGLKQQGFQSSAMEYGVETEAEARKCYEMMMGVAVKQVGFCFNDSQDYGCSPDGLVGEDGLVEIKCPQTATMVEYLLKDEMPSTYIQQVQGQLLVTGREWCDFIAYSKGLKPFIKRVYRDEMFIAALEFVLKEFCAELAEVVEKIK